MPCCPSSAHAFDTVLCNILLSIVHLDSSHIVFPATMAESIPASRAVCEDNSTYRPQPYSSRAVNRAPATSVKYFNSVPPSSRPIFSQLAHLHPSLLPLLSLYLSQHHPQQAEISPSNQALLAFRKPQSLRQTTKHSRSSGRNRLRNTSRQTKLSATFRHILE
jgi:hypothetical protein